MRTQSAWIALIGAAVFAGWWGVGNVMGQNAREDEQQIRKMRQLVKELVEAGRDDEAERAARQIEEIRQLLDLSGGEVGHRPKQAPNRELEERLVGMRQRIAALKEAGRDDAADRLAQEAREMIRRAQGQPIGEAGERGVGLEQRIGHLREAGTSTRQACTT